MSWLAKSIADTLSLNDQNDAVTTNPNSSPRGVKEDLSEITQTLSRQFWGVASFLSPPPNSDQNTNNHEQFDPKSDQKVNNHEQSDPNSDQKVINREGFDRNLDKNVNNSEGFDGNSDNTEGIDGLDDEGSEGVGISGIRSDLSEIGGRFKSGISKLSENIKVSEISKMATGWREFLEKAVEDMNEEEAKKAVGVNEDVVAFAKDVALHPETWLDFPLPDDDMEEEFDMTDAQQEHALAVESLAPSIASLRMELCPEYISESSFWKIYFVLVHRILDKEAAVILSTPQVMEARALLTTDLQKHPKVKQDYDLSTTSIDQKDGSSVQHEVSLSVPSGAPENETETVVVPKSDASTYQKDTSNLRHQISLPLPISTPENATPTVVVPKSDASTEAADSDMVKNSTSNIDIQVVDKSATASIAADSQTDKHQITPLDIQIDDKSVIEVGHDNQTKDQNVQPGPSNSWDNEEEEEDHDDWLKEEISELGGGASATTIPIDNDDDVSFSDLEDNDEDAPSTLKKENYTSDKESREWVQL